MCYIQVKNIRLNSFYEEKKIKLCLTKQLLNMFKLWCEWGIRFNKGRLELSDFCFLFQQVTIQFKIQIQQVYEYKFSKGTVRRN